MKFSFLFIIRIIVIVHHYDVSVTCRCPCDDILPRPDLWKKSLTARWMVHSLDWGVLTTLSSRLYNNDRISFPFGNVYSFIDGSCSNATGTPYFYGTDMDQSFQDMKHNSYASLTLSEASLDSTCLDTTTDDFVRKACVISNIPSSSSSTKNETTYPGDPENPLCARLTLSGSLVEVDNTTIEYNDIKLAFYERHPQMSYWPSDHHWKIIKLQISDIWLIDYFGGATILSPEQYYEYDNIIPIATNGY